VIVSSGGHVHLGCPEFTGHVKSLGTLLATSLLATYPSAKALASALPGRSAKLRYDGRHRVGAEFAMQSMEAATCLVARHHGPAYALQARHVCQDLELSRADTERDIAEKIDRHDVDQLITTVGGIGPQTAARMIAAAGDLAQFKSAAAFEAVLLSLRQSGKRTAARAGIGPLDHARLRRALWMPTLGVVRRSEWLRPFYERLRVAGKPAQLALLVAMRKLLYAALSVA
jgi:transposase